MLKVTNPFKKFIPHPDREYYSLEEVATIIEESYNSCEGYFTEEQKSYLAGHKERYCKTLAMIPKARSAEDLCLDIGGAVLTPFWLSHYWGYKVHVLNKFENLDADVEVQTVSFGECQASVTCLDCDLELEWPVSEQYDVIVFLETLEHISCPDTVFKKLNQVAHFETLVFLTTPNAHSLWVLREWLKGLPPWVYRYFSPDIHQFRHVFEHTPASLYQLVSSNGFETLSFFTDYCYDIWLPSSAEAILSTFSLQKEEHGEVLFLVLMKHGLPDSTQSSILYDSDEFYSNEYSEYDDVYYKKLSNILKEKEKMQDYKRSNDAMKKSNQELSAEVARMVLEKERILQKKETSSSSYACKLKGLTRYLGNIRFYELHKPCYVKHIFQAVLQRVFFKIRQDPYMYSKARQIKRVVVRLKSVFCN